MEATRSDKATPNHNQGAVALELSAKGWEVGINDGRRTKPTIHTVSDDHPASRPNVLLKAGCSSVVKGANGLHWVSAGTDCGIAATAEAMGAATTSP